jgi:hypothetical protein
MWRISIRSCASGVHVSTRGRIQALQNIWVGLKGKSNEFLNLPIDFFVLALQLLRNTRKRPFHIGRRKVKSVPISIGPLLAQAVCGRADDAAIDHETIEVCGIRAAGYLCLNMLEDCQVGAAKALFSAIRETDTVAVFRGVRGVDHKTHPSGRFGQHLRAFRDYDVNLLFALQDYLPDASLKDATISMAPIRFRLSSSRSSAGIQYSWWTRPVSTRF